MVDPLSHSCHCHILHILPFCCVMLIFTENTNFPCSFNSKSDWNQNKIKSSDPKCFHACDFFWGIVSSPSPVKCGRLHGNASYPQWPSTSSPAGLPVKQENGMRIHAINFEMVQEEGIVWHWQTPPPPKNYMNLDARLAGWGTKASRDFYFRPIIFSSHLNRCSANQWTSPFHWTCQNGHDRTPIPEREKRVFFAEHFFDRHLGKKMVMRDRKHIKSEMKQRRDSGSTDLRNAQLKKSLYIFNAPKSS